MEYLKKVFTPKQILWLIISGAVTVVFLAVMFAGIALSKTQPAQLAASRWSKDRDCTQISIFFSEMSAHTPDNIRELDFNIDKKLDEKAIAAATKEARRRVSAYSASGEITVRSRESEVTARAIGIGGDYFLFHPLKLITGSYFDGADLVKDHIILDLETASLLFGSGDVVGQPVEINGKRYYVTGVIEKDTGRLNDLAGNDSKVVYVDYETLEECDKKTSLNAYEVLLPSPVSHFGSDIVKDVVTEDATRYEMVENTGRFSWTRLIKRITAVGSRSMNSKGIIYPYWENMARGLEDMITPLCVIDLVLFSFVFVNICVLLVRMYTNRTIHKKDIKDFIERRIEKYRKERARKKEEGELI